MSTNLRVDGIKLSLEMTLMTIGVCPDPLNLNTRFLKLMGKNRINLPFLCIAARDETYSGTYCILTEDLTRAKTAIASDEKLMAHSEFLSSAGAVSVFPHNFSLEFMGLMIRLMGESDAPLYGLATSISALSMITDFAMLEQTAGYISRHVTLPGNHSPFRPDIRIKSM